ncbi:M48 family metallopeptidase [Oceanicella actignis]|uniref:M48 family metallopeptidase n=1 Tax=Oceanicella actignis TaxID=1189325 RepID=UPI0011E66116|nr:SprT family zinc-dependent metalloprotease [Oceanicella actignis]TYO90484.1 hypothetical protein LY05_00613 [Oceanicella actignis]
MGVSIRLERPSVSVTVRRSARSRRFSLSVSRIDGRPLLTIPEAASLDEARGFLERHAEWLSGALDRAPGALPVTEGMTLPIGGRPVVLRADPARRRGAPALSGDALLIPPSAAGPGPAVKTFLIARSRDALTPAARRHAAALGKAPARVTLRDTRSRWGSCTAEGALSFSWRLAMAPPAVQDYVAAHEAAHLVEMNHGPRFWALVERLRPDWREQRAWLRANGAALHRFRFDPAG